MTEEETKSDAPSAPRQLAERSLFFAQGGLVLGIFALVLIGYAVEHWRDDGRSFGTFWFAFMIGALGSSIALTRRVRTSQSVAANLAQSKISVAMPLLYGGLMASVAYLLFLSGVLSGDSGGGLITTNLFPNFTGDEQGALAPSVTAYLEFRPATMRDAGKLLVWSFIAGYSETFVKNLLSQLESRGAAGSS